MRAAVKTDDGTFEPADVPMPHLPAQDWVLARVRVAGICGTDLRHWRKAEPDLSGHVVGHELAGEVVDVGADVTTVRPGQRVVIESVLGDGTCEWCRVQQYNICPHLYDVRSESVARAYAEYVVGPQDRFYVLPDSVTFEQAALVDTLSVCLHAQHLSGLSIGDTVAVLGAGPIGLGQLLLAKASGAEVIITDVLEGPLALAKQLGADAVVNSRTEDPVPRIRHLTGGRGVDIAFECSGGPAMPQTLAQATAMARRGGTVVIVGGFDPGEVSIPLEWQRIQMSEIRLLPSASFAMKDIYREQGMVVDLLAKGSIDVSPLITHRFPLDRINEAFEAAENKADTGAVFVALAI